MTQLLQIDRPSESEHQLRLVADNAPVGIVHCDAELRYKFINRRHAEQLGVMPEEVIGKPLPEVLGDELFALFEPYARECLAGKVVEFEIELPGRADGPRFLQCRLEPEWSDGKVVGLASAGTDITHLKRAQAALRESNDRLQFALDAAQLGWWQYDPLRQVISGDARAKELFDVTCDDMSIEEILTKRLHPHDAERVWIAFQAALDPDDPKPYATQYRVQRTDGEVRWVEAHGLAHFEGSGPERRAASIVGTVQDITERKKREEKQQLLMLEVNHRAKNMLSVVDAIAHRTASNNPEDFIERFSERIQALSANQDLLVRNEWLGVDLDDLVGAQLVQFVGLIGSRIAVQGAKLRLKPASAQAIGLAIRELASNAGKYGSLSTERGRVDVSWAIANETFTMSWTEREGPPVSNPQRRGFGTIVMEAMAARSVDGEVKLDYAPSGLTWHLTCHASNVRETEP